MEEINTKWLEMFGRLYQLTKEVDELKAEIEKLTEMTNNMASSGNTNG